MSNFEAPNSCAVCGVGRRAHAWRSGRGVGIHSWIEPSDAHRLARMKFRRAQRAQTVSRPLRRAALGQTLLRKRDGLTVIVERIDADGLTWIRAAGRERTWPVKDVWRLYR